MRLTLSLLFLSVNTVFTCEYSRTSGLFEHGFTSTAGTDNFVAETGEDDDASYDNKASISFSKFKVFSSVEFDSVDIYDSGMLVLYASTDPPTPTTTYDGSSSPFSILNQAFAVALWFEEDGATEYRFKYKHLKASDLVQGLTDIGPSKCELQRLKNIIGDCSANGYRKDTPDIDEMLIVTWQIIKGSDTYYFQTVLAVNENGNTYVVFLYSDTASVPDGVKHTSGYISGDTVTVGLKNAGVCPFTLTGVKDTDLHEKSNCRCGDWNKGIYVFETEAGDECKGTGKDESGFVTECNALVTTDNTENLDNACRPARNLQDTCLELVYCRDTGAGTEVNIKVVNPPFQSNTALTFVDQTDFASGTISENDCRKQLTQEGSTDVYSTTITLDTVSTCDWTESGDIVNFVARLYDATEAELEKAGGIYLKATCDVLPTEKSVSVKHGSIAEYDIPKVVGRRVEMFFNNQRFYQYNSDVTKIPDGVTVPLGQDLYLAIGYDWGDKLVNDKIEPYGIYAKDCKVSNNENFDNTGTNNRVTQLTDANGCVVNTLTSSKAFYISESFKIALQNSGTTDLVSDQLTTTFNYVITSAKFDAAKWLVGGSNKVYVQCTVGFCRNQAYKMSSKCWDVCANTGVDYALTGRKKRTANETNEDPYPDVKVQTSVTIVSPEDDSSPEVECVSNVVAYSTLLALTVLLLVAMGVTLMLFVRLQARQRKKIY